MLPEMETSKIHIPVEQECNKAYLLGKVLSQVKPL
jgi:hypothetical protein